MGDWADQGSHPFLVSFILEECSLEECVLCQVRGFCHLFHTAGRFQWLAEICQQTAATTWQHKLLSSKWVCGKLIDASRNVWRAQSSGHGAIQIVLQEPRRGEGGGGTKPRLAFRIRATQSSLPGVS